VGRLSAVGRLAARKRSPTTAPGDRALEQLAEHTALTNSAMLLANHDPVVAGDKLSAALDAIEELEETASSIYCYIATRPGLSRRIRSPAALI
jgi:ribulose-5-phosphate 4-epimerase/fuculose-1-phosphate aldolase